MERKTSITTETNLVCRSVERRSVVGQNQGIILERQYSNLKLQADWKTYKKTAILNDHFPVIYFTDI